MLLRELFAMASRQRFRLAYLVGVAIWATAVVAGFHRLIDYENTPGDSGKDCTHWPIGTRLIPQSDHAHLVMFVHPRCACTQSSIEELAQLMASSHDLISAHVLFLRPAHTSDDWERTRLWNQCALIPGIRVSADENGAEACLFGAATSGETFLFDAHGRLLFRGGLTNARGHAGESIGRVTILKLLAGSATDRPVTPVFGCPLCNPSRDEE